VREILKNMEVEMRIEKEEPRRRKKGVGRNGEIKVWIEN